MDMLVALSVVRQYLGQPRKLIDLWSSLMANEASLWSFLRQGWIRNVQICCLATGHVSSWTGIFSNQFMGAGDWQYLPVYPVLPLRLKKHSWSCLSSSVWAISHQWSLHVSSLETTHNLTKLLGESTITTKPHKNNRQNPTIFSFKFWSFLTEICIYTPKWKERKKCLYDREHKPHHELLLQI